MPIMASIPSPLPSPTSSKKFPFLWKTHSSSSAQYKTSGLISKVISSCITKRTGH